MDTAAEHNPQPIPAKELAKNVFRKVFIGDLYIWTIVFILIGMSLLAIYSSTVSKSYVDKGGDFNWYLFNQIKMIGVGFFGFVIIRFIPVHFYKKYAWFLFCCTILLMVITYARGISLNSAKRWLNIFGFSLQTSDFMKIGLIILLSKRMYDWRGRIGKLVFVPLKELFDYKNHREKTLSILKNYTLRLLGPIALCCMMIIPTNLSTGLVLGMISVLFLIVGGVAIREIKKIILVAMAALVLFIIVLSIFDAGRLATWESRITQFVGVGGDDGKEGDSFNVSEMTLEDAQRFQSDIAIANGWLLGKGFGNSTQRSNLPNSYSDFIYSFIVEEWGIVGAVLVMFVYIWFFYRTIQISRKCTDPFSGLLCTGMGLLFCMSAFSHICVCIGLLPVTGLTLPLISHGGSSILFSFTVFSIIQRIAYEQQQEEKRELAATAALMTAQQTTEIDTEPIPDSGSVSER